MTILYLEECQTTTDNITFAIKYLPMISRMMTSSIKRLFAKQAFLLLLQDIIIELMSMREKVGRLGREL